MGLVVSPPHISDAEAFQQVLIAAGKGGVLALSIPALASVLTCLGSVALLVWDSKDFSKDKEEGKYLLPFELSKLQLS